jgi:hypothetical protein
MDFELIITTDIYYRVYKSSSDDKSTNLIQVRFLLLIRVFV